MVLALAKFRFVVWYVTIGILTAGNQPPSG